VEAVAITSHLSHPWALVVVAPDTFLVTERRGVLSLVVDSGRRVTPVAGLPPIESRRGGEGGLLGLALSPNFAETRRVFWAFTERSRDTLSALAVATGTLVFGPTPAVHDARVIYRQTPAINSGFHLGGRLVFAPDGTLFVTHGDARSAYGLSLVQRLGATVGKTVRIRDDGSIPTDNPFRSSNGERSPVWSLGHLNVQAAAIQPGTGQLWVAEHGSNGGDEVNIVFRGANYGWPLYGYGKAESGDSFPDGRAAKGFEQPVYFWEESLAPSGMIFSSGRMIPAWKGDILIGSLARRCLVRLQIRGGVIRHEEHLLVELRERIRDVAEGPDGAVYLLTDGEDARILRLSPRLQR
jgi:glucose/arabinose dehydrogenase